RKPIFFFARKSLFDHPVANHILTRMNALPVNQARPELSVLKRIITLLREDRKVLIFPEGERSWDGEMKGEGQSGVGMIVSRAGVPVLPVRLFGPEKALPRGAKSIKRHPVTLVVGEPIDFSELVDDENLGSKEKYQRIADRIMKAIGDLEMSESRGE
ncbi:MAG: lysophospholipid acyltransferase family protein, partial [Verrucomicrobiota bacterium]